MRPAAFALAALIATPALAQEAPQATAPRTTMSVADQIDEYLRTSPAAEIDDDVPGVTSRDGRRPHGEVAVGIGTGGYRSIYMRGDFPVGESGRVSVAIEDTRYGRGYGYAPGLGHSLGSPIDRQRCDLEGLTPPRPLDVVGGPNGRCVGSPGR